MNSPLKEGNMSLEKPIAIVIHVNANLNHNIMLYNEITANLPSRHLPLYCEVLKVPTILVANVLVLWQFSYTVESKSHDASSCCM